MMKQKWLERAKANKAELEKRKLDEKNGIEPAKKPKYQPRCARAYVAPMKKDIQSVPLEQLSWPEFRVAQPAPCTIDPSTLSFDFETQTKPDSPDPVFVNISSATGSPLVMKLSGGGTIPNRFGVTPKASGDYNCKIVLSDAKESRCLNKLCDDAMVALAKMAQSFYPKGCSLSHADFAYRFYSKPTAKESNANEMWPSSLRVAVKLKDIDNKQVSIVKEDGTPIQVVSHMEGMCWKELRVLFQCGMFGWLWSEKQNKYLPQVRLIVKLVGTTQLIEDVDSCHLVYPTQRAEHDLQNCVRKHHVPINILSRPTAADLLFGEPEPTTGGLKVSTHVKDGTDFILEFSCGGGLPGFIVSCNQQEKTTMNIYIENKLELEAADLFTKSMNEYMIHHRAKYFPTLSDKEDSTILAFCKPLIKAKNASGATESRLMTVRVDVEYNGSNCMIVDENNQLVNDLETLENRRFETLWISYIGNYMNSNEAGPTKRIKYLKLAPKVEQFTIDGQ